MRDPAVREGCAERRARFHAAIVCTSVGRVGPQVNGHNGLYRILLDPVLEVSVAVAHR